MGHTMVYTLFKVGGSGLVCRMIFKSDLSPVLSIKIQVSISSNNCAYQPRGYRFKGLSLDLRGKIT
jgi:hypothetical protein